MPRPRIDAIWRARVKELTEQGPQRSGRQIAEMLKAEAAVAERDDWPSEKTVRNIMAEHRATPIEERRLYNQVFWPESFGTPELPWEAASVVLEAIRDVGGDKVNRPTVRTAKWVWRLSLAGSDMSLWERLLLARNLAACEASALPNAEETWRSIEIQLIHPERTQKGFVTMTTAEAAEAEDLFPPGFAEEMRKESRLKIEE